jgi:hypothetical protein
LFVELLNIAVFVYLRCSWLTSSRYMYYTKHSLHIHTFLLSQQRRCSGPGFVLGHRKQNKKKSTTINKETTISILKLKLQRQQYFIQLFIFFGTHTNNVSTVEDRACDTIKKDIRAIAVGLFQPFNRTCVGGEKFSIGQRCPRAYLQNIL